MDARVRRDIDKERFNATKKYGPLRGGMQRWRHHLQEEVGEAVFEMGALSMEDADREPLYRELIQVASLACQMAEMICNKEDIQN